MPAARLSRCIVRQRAASRNGRSILRIKASACGLLCRVKPPPAPAAAAWPEASSPSTAIRSSAPRDTEKTEATAPGSWCRRPPVSALPAGSPKPVRYVCHSASIAAAHAADPANAALSPPLQPHSHLRNSYTLIGCRITPTARLFLGHGEAVQTTDLLQVFGACSVKCGPAYSLQRPASGGAT